MGELLYFTVDKALSMGGEELANAIWRYKYHDEVLRTDDSEYTSWKESLPVFLDCVRAAGLNKLYVVFEMKTPISRKAIDVTLIGYNKDNEDAVSLLIIELKRWNAICLKQVKNTNKVYIPIYNNKEKTNCLKKVCRRHPFHQLNIYEKNVMNHHSGIQKAREKDGMNITTKKIAYLHNFKDVQKFKTNKYKDWSNFDGEIFGEGLKEKEKLINMLKKSLSKKENKTLINILIDNLAIMGDDGLKGLRLAYTKNSEEFIKMENDQQKIVEIINTEFDKQEKNPHKEIIVVSGGSGTGKTILGIRLILEYSKRFNNDKNDNKAIFCLPKSRTMKAMFDAACSVEEEHENEYCCFLDEINVNQNLVVIDEAHRIIKLEDSLNDVFNKNAKMVVMLQDDHQIIRPGEEGTYQAIKNYSEKYNIEFLPEEKNKNTLMLIDEKRCDEELLNGLIKLFYDEGVSVKENIACVEVFNNLYDLTKWKDEKAIRNITCEPKANDNITKYIFPFCFKWVSKRKNIDYDFKINEFEWKWNPEDADEQVLWLQDNTDDRVASIYTSQGLDFDNVAFVWWDDLTWDETNSKWVGNIEKIVDTAFKCKYDESVQKWKQLKWDDKASQYVEKENGFLLSQDEITSLIINTYYVMLTRPKKQLGIWFHDEATKKHVLSVLKPKKK